MQKKVFFYSGLTQGWYRWPIRSLYRFWLTAHLIPLEPLGAVGLANVPRKCTLIKFFRKVNSISITDAPAVIYCLAIYISRFLK